MAPKAMSPAMVERITKEIDEGIIDFERKCKKQEQNKGSMVKRNAAEKDVLKAAEKLRDFLMDAVKGDKQVLAEVFGGDCARFWRIKNTMDGTELLPANEKDQRWKALREAMDIIEEVLKQFGQFKPYKAPAPETLGYKDVYKHNKNPVNNPPEEMPKRLVPGQPYQFQAFVAGCDRDTVSFSVSPSLPTGLVLDENTGEISGYVPVEFSCEESTWTVTAENKSGKVEAQLTFAVKALPPSELSYGVKDKSATIGESIKWTPALGGGDAEGYEIAGDLPAGLTFDPATGIISGTPTHATQEPKEYTITAKNGAGECKATFTLKIHDAPPTKLQYPDLPQGDICLGQNCYFVPEVTLGNPQKGGRRMTMAVGQEPSTWGRNFATSGNYVGTKWGKVRAKHYEQMMLQGFLPDLKFECSPPLPKGLHLAHNTGIITGVPQEEFKRQVYKITCTNASGKTQVDISLGVVQKAPAKLKYPEVPDVLYSGSPVTLSPEVENVPKEWSIEPALPEGLSLNKEMGIISGIPKELCEKKAFTVTASNGAGSCSTKVTLTVRRVAPSEFVYQEAQTEYPVGKPLELVPLVEGSVDEFELEGELPKGLQFDPKTGRISGTPTEATETRAFNLKAKNESGAATTMLAFEIKEMPPSDLRYPRMDALYNVGERVDAQPELQGLATKWTIEPALPPGMEFNTSTGAITGSPTKEAEETSYTVTASNEAGGTSTVIDFGVAAAAPEGLSYPVFENIIAGRDITLEPDLQGVVREAEVEYMVAPPLPKGLNLDNKTGVISGSPEAPQEKTTYKITAKTKGGTASCDLDIFVEAPVQQVAPRKSHRASVVGVVDPEFVATLEEVTDLAQLPPNPGVEMRENWMVWMVHRVYLNDPTLDVLDFTNMEMPLPHVEPRVAPKLMKALAFNTHLKKLLLADSNLRAPQAHQLAEAIKQNKVLKELNIESNWLDPEALKAFAAGLKSEGCNEGQLAIVRIANQVGLETVGRPIEQAVAEAMRENKVVTRLGFSCDDPHWNDVISKALIRNGDLARRKRKGLGDGSSETSKRAAAKERALERVELQTPPDQAVWEVFEDDDKNLTTVRQFVAEKKTVPTNQQLQAFAAGKEAHIPYGKIGPLLKGFGAKLFDATKGKVLALSSNKDGTDEGTLIAWSEKNQKWCLEVHKNGEAYFKYLSEKNIEIQVSEAVAAWIKPE